MKERSLKVLLINPFFIYSEDMTSYDLSRVQNRVQFVEQPLGLGSISSYIQKHLPEVKVKVFDANGMAVKNILSTNRVDMPYLYSEVEKELRTFKPDIIGISALFEFCGYIVNLFADLCKLIVPETLVVIGGAYASFSYARALKNPNIDFVIRGEGEESFRQFLEYILGRRQLSEVGSLIHRKNDHSMVQVNDRSQPLNDLSVLTPVDRNNSYMDIYATRSRHMVYKFFPERDSRVASLFASRGCPYQCGFCSTTRVWGPGIRYRPLPSILTEMEYLIHEYGINTFFFIDDNIAADRDFFRRLLKGIIRLQQKHDIKWISGGFQATKLDEELIQLCIESGLVCFSVAFESGSARSLKLIKKPLTLEKAERFVEMFRKCAPNAYMFGSWLTGLPFETKDDIALTHEFARRLDLDWSSFYCYQPYPGTPIYEECVSRGYIKIDDDAVVYPDAIISNAISTDNFTSEYVISANYHANLEINFLNNRNLRGRGSRHYAYQDFIDIVTVYPDHVFGYYSLSEYFMLENNIAEAKKYLGLASEAMCRTRYFDKYIKEFDIKLGSAIANK